MNIRILRDRTTFIVQRGVDKTSLHTSIFSGPRQAVLKLKVEHRLSRG